MHILVVDDDIPTVEVIRTSLHWDLLGIDRVETAYDYTEAQNKICASQPDIILCDIEMPRGSGLDLLRWLREEKRDCEFVFLTCHANFDYAKTALQYGAADYITKPFNIAQTEATLLPRCATTRSFCKKAVPASSGRKPTAWPRHPSCTDCSWMEP